MANSYTRIVAGELANSPATRAELINRMSLPKEQIDEALKYFRKAGKIKKDAEGRLNFIGPDLAGSVAPWYADIKSMGWLAQQPRFGAERINDYWQRIE